MSDLNLTLNVTDYSGIYYDPNQYTFFGFMGITAALVFCNLGSAYGTARPVLVSPPSVSSRVSSSTSPSFPSSWLVSWVSMASLSLSSSRVVLPPPSNKVSSLTLWATTLMVPPAMAALATVSPAATPGPTLPTTATSISPPVFAAVSPPSLPVSASVLLVMLVSVLT